MGKKIAVIGAGQAAIAFAAKMRELDDEASITLYGDETSLPYQRPPLSKKYMTGEIEGERLLLRPDEWYQENNITCKTNCLASDLNLTDKTFKADGNTVQFDKLLIATGARPRPLQSSSNGELEGVFTLRDLKDADAISDKMQDAKQALIIGGGYIGLEAAAVLRTKGIKVRVLEMADRILQRVASHHTSDFIRDKHVSHGVEISENFSIDHLLQENGKVSGAKFVDGSTLAVDLVLVGIGVLPNMELAKQAGLVCGNGIEVDQFTRTSHPDIHAAGDVASFEFRGNRCRLESVQNAIDQAEAAAKVIAGNQQPYAPYPWFWSDQYDLKLQIAGLNTDYDETIIREGSRPGGQSIWYFKNGDLIAVDALNDSKAYMFGKKILELGRTISPQQAGDNDFDLKQLIK